MQLDRLLIDAVKKNDRKAVEEALENGADINAIGKLPTIVYEAFTPLGHAVDGNHLSLAEFLIERGADVNASMRSHSHAEAYKGRPWTALHIAAFRGNLKCAEMLLQHQAKADYVAVDLAERARRSVLAHVVYEALKEQQKAAPEIATGWRAVDAQQVAYVQTSPETGYRLTELFNFATRRFTQLAQNLETKAESQTVRFFDEFVDKAPLEQARLQLNALGGTVEPNAIYADAAKLKPKNLTAKPDF